MAKQKSSFTITPIMALAILALFMMAFPLVSYAFK